MEAARLLTTMQLGDEARDPSTSRRCPWRVPVTWLPSVAQASKSSCYSPCAARPHCSLGVGMCKCSWCRVRGLRACYLRTRQACRDQEARAPGVCAESTPGIPCKGARHIGLRPAHLQLVPGEEARAGHSPRVQGRQSPRVPGEHSLRFKAEVRPACGEGGLDATFSPDTSGERTWQSHGRGGPARAERARVEQLVKLPPALKQALLNSADSLLECTDTECEFWLCEISRIVTFLYNGHGYARRG